MVIIGISIMLFSGFLMTRITKLLRLPNVTAYIVAGILVGGAVGAVIELSKPKPTLTDDVDDGEDEGFEISM
jgi:Kef-type K+ transport system membrane component KefB